MLWVGCCALFVVSRLLVVVVDCCKLWLFVMVLRCVLFVVCDRVFVVCGLCVVRCLLCVACCFLFPMTR